MRRQTLRGLLTTIIALGFLIAPVGAWEQDEDEQAPSFHQEREQAREPQTPRDYPGSRAFRERGRLPERLTIERKGRCEVRCERDIYGRTYQCREYRC